MAARRAFLCAATCLSAYMAISCARPVIHSTPTVSVPHSQEVSPAQMDLGAALGGVLGKINAALDADVKLHSEIGKMVSAHTQTAGGNIVTTSNSNWVVGLMAISLLAAILTALFSDYFWYRHAVQQRRRRAGGK